MTTYEIIIIIINSLMFAVALAALVFGAVYLNKKLKVYIYIDENSILKIIAFNKGNRACKFDKYRYSIDDKKFKEEYQPCISANEIVIDTNNLGNYRIIKIEILDNFGRKYKYQYKNTKD